MKAVGPIELLIFHQPQLLVDEFLHDFGRSSHFLVVQKHQLAHIQVQSIAGLKQIWITKIFPMHLQ
jgi:hypothetical protein